jgi:hypothetical protein
MDTETMLKLIDEDRRRVVSPNFRGEVSQSLVRWCSVIEKEIKIKYSVCLRHMCMTGRAERGYRDPALKRAACPRQA